MSQVDTIPEEEEQTIVYEAILKKLKDNNVEFEELTHKPCMTSEESAAERNAPLASGAKAILLEKDSNVYLVVFSAAKRLNNKLIRKEFGKGKFVDRQHLIELTTCLPGAVPPFASLLNGCKKTYCDESLREQGDYIWYNAGLRTHSIKMKVEDYIRIESPEFHRFTE